MIAFGWETIILMTVDKFVILHARTVVLEIGYETEVVVQLRERCIVGYVMTGNAKSDFLSRIIDVRQVHVLPVVTRKSCMAVVHV